MSGRELVAEMMGEFVAEGMDNLRVPRSVTKD